jgi:predicted esterase
MFPSDLEWVNHKELMEFLDKTIAESPEPIDGICGYSEGASIAATYILHEEKMEREHGRPRRIKCALFFTGMPPVGEEKGYIFADQREEMIDLQTIHFIGAAGTFVISWTEDIA